MIVLLTLCPCVFSLIYWHSPFTMPLMVVMLQNRTNAYVIPLGQASKIYHTVLPT